jgi:hypothetical protein
LPLPPSVLIDDVLEDDVRQLDHKSAKTGIFLNKGNVVVGKTFFVHRVLFALHGRLTQAPLLLKKLPFAIRRICVSHGYSSILTKEPNRKKLSVKQDWIESRANLSLKLEAEGAGPVSGQSRKTSAARTGFAHTRHRRRGGRATAFTQFGRTRRAIYKKILTPLSNQVRPIRPWVMRTESQEEKAMPTIAERAQILRPALGRLLNVVTMLCSRGSCSPSIDLLFAFYHALMVLSAVWLRERALRVLNPFTRWLNLPAFQQYGAIHV